MCDSPSKATEILTNSLNNILDEMAPIRKIQVRKKYVPWLSATTKELLKERDTAQAKAASSRDQNYWRAYKHLRNTTTSKIRAEKRAWEQQKLDAAQHNSSTLWSNIKTWLS